MKKYPAFLLATTVADIKLFCSINVRRPPKVIIDKLVAIDQISFVMGKEERAFGFSGEKCYSRILLVFRGSVAIMQYLQACLHLAIREAEYSSKKKKKNK
jgi:hypothetical protein